VTEVGSLSKKLSTQARNPHLKNLLYSVENPREVIVQKAIKISQHHHKNSKNNIIVLKLQEQYSSPLLNTGHWSSVA
jgi:hypothetical protein